MLFPIEYVLIYIGIGLLTQRKISEYLKSRADECASLEPVESESAVDTSDPEAGDGDRDESE